MRIGELLVERGVLTRAQVEEILETQEREHSPFGEVAERLFGVQPDAIESALITQITARATLISRTDEVDEAVASLVVRRQAWQFGFVPMRFEDGHLVAATTAASLARAVRFAVRILEIPTMFAIADESTLSALLQSQYPIPGMAQGMLDGTEEVRWLGKRKARKRAA
ncbi:MAG: hypothetical protein EXS10_08900 [Phycisphaerales bacterium]|nr:hypothetical protein [Phycisphaerales bacterium]